jgi:uncharacterized RDD family membrane protein YckC
MPSIEISTTQNVTIQYDLADLKDRALAFLLDFLIIIAGVFVLWLLSLAFAMPIGYFAVLIMWPVIIFYVLVSEIVGNGQSVGKLALQIKVVKLNGKQASIGDYMLRWVFRLIDIYLSLGSLAALLISSSPKGQRIGDMLAGTTVIKVRPTVNMSLNDLLNISSLDTYQPVYHSVRTMSEEDMLLVKSVIERARKYPNPAHLDAVDMTVRHLMEKLGITSVPINKPEFLKTVLKDYIVLTR